MSDIDLKALREAIEVAEHKPGDWGKSPFEMAGICTYANAVEYFMPGAERPKAWGNFSYKRDSWLAIAAVNALPALIDHLESAERRAEEAEKERDALTVRVLTGPADATVTIQDGDFLGQLTDAMGAIERAGQSFVDERGSLLSLAEQIDRLAAERDALRKDAERYRWLCGADVPPHSTRWPRWRLEYWGGFHAGWNPVMGIELDQAIDAAMAQEGGK